MNDRTDRNATWDIRAADVPRDLFPGGRLRFSLGIRPGREADRRREHLETLRRAGEWEILRGIQDGLLDVAEVTRRVKKYGERAAHELKADLERAEAGAVPAFAQERERYLEWYQAHREPGSVKSIRSRLSRVGEQRVGDDGEALDQLSLDRIRKDHLERAMLEVSSAGHYLNAIRAALSGMLSWSIEREAEEARTERRAPRWTENPATKLEVRDTSPRVETASEDQVLALLAATELYQRAYLRPLLHLGLRRDELIHTRLHADLDLETWRWVIQPRGPDPRCPCAQCQGGGWSPKTRQSERSFIVPAIEGGNGTELLRSAITGYLELYPAEPGDYLFRNPRTGEVWSKTRLRTDFRGLCRRAGVKYGRKVPGGITLHTLRHTCATQLVRAGVRESVGAKLVGDTVDTYVRTYVHLTDKDLADGVRRGPSYA